MKITRYFQSCLLIEEGQARILIDPSGQEEERLNKFGELSAVLYTHEHGDHFEPGMADKFIQSGVSVYANESTAKQMTSKPNIVEDEQRFDVKGVKVTAIELPHCLMWDGSEGPQNTGYIIGEKLFHPGDGKELAEKIFELLAVPITGPDVSIKDAIAFCKQVQAKTVIPVHYDFIGTKPEVFASVSGGEFKVKTLAIGETIEL